jgi:hypothetical protein
MEHRWNEIDRGKPKNSGKNLSNTNPTWTEPGSNPGLRGGRPAANRLGHGTSPLNPYSVKAEIELRSSFGKFSAVCLGRRTLYSKFVL